MKPLCTNSDRRADIQRMYDAVTIGLPPMWHTWGSPERKKWTCRKCRRQLQLDVLMKHYDGCVGVRPERCKKTWPRCRLAHGHLGRCAPAKHKYDYSSDY